jgi:hypothetical protein
MRSLLNRKAGTIACGTHSACATLILLIVPLVGCTWGARKQAAAPPPTPKPAAVQPPAPDEPLSIAQTAVTLPPEQPVNPDAIPKVQAAPEAPAPEKVEAPPAPRTARRSTAGPPKPPEPESEPEVSPTPAVQEQAPIQPILGGDERKRIQGDVEARKREINEKLSRAKGHLSEHDQSQVDRIQSFLAQCAQAEQRGDYSQADALSLRALVLAQGLQIE